MQHNNDYFSKLIEKSEVVIKNRVPVNTLRRRVNQPMQKFQPENDVTFLESDWYFDIRTYSCHCHGTRPVTFNTEFHFGIHRGCL